MVERTDADHFRIDFALSVTNCSESMAYGSFEYKLLWLSPKRCAYLWNTHCSWSWLKSQGGSIFAAFQHVQASNPKIGLISLISLQWLVTDTSNVFLAISRTPSINFAQRRKQFCLFEQQSVTRNEKKCQIGLQGDERETNVVKKQTGFARWIALNECCTWEHDNFQLIYRFGAYLEGEALARNKHQISGCTY